ncbi:DUF1292 domain-containing protein [Candidatus Epulonipiscium viviparus]|uniref:DUF1292 domain-containing protein n=1 Tax=Candidatus Epulonipiscium viviparus TaxID=420336 RepID=UPI0027380D53|nr:DUF1292 domain-containing protein [Candidatus Epulopiscium viviparus]
MEKIIFYDEDTGEEILFEIVDSTVFNDNKYLLVVDEDDEATILKEAKDKDDNLVYSLIENEDEFQQITLILMESDEYDIEVN